MRTRNTLYFTAPYEVEVREEPLPTPTADQVLVQTQYSGISAGTEMLIYEGNAPQNLAADDALDSLSGSLTYPVKYGYSAVGTVAEVGDAVDDAWKGLRVFAFQPHTSHFVASPDALVRLPDRLDPAAAVLLPNMETAVNLVLDARPLIGERACVFGQGIVGLLTTALLGRFPLRHVLAVEPLETRRRLSTLLGADDAIDTWASWEPENPPDAHGAVPNGRRSDFAFELTGQPRVLNDAIESVGFDGRVIVGSWYGTKRAELNLGGSFHRQRKRIISSQVSTIAPRLRGRWSKARRIGEALEELTHINTDLLLSHFVNQNKISDAYKMISAGTDDHLQVVIKYPT